MLPLALSTGLTSLVEGEDRAAIVIEMVVAADGSLGRSNVYPRAGSQQRATAVHRVGPWLEGKGPAPRKLAASADLQTQLHLQDQAASAMRAKRFRLGGLTFDRIEAQPVFSNGRVSDSKRVKKNRANDLIEDLMVAANEVMARHSAQQQHRHHPPGGEDARRVGPASSNWPHATAKACRSHPTPER